MSTWLALARSAPGVMVELLTQRTSVYCLVSGHTPDWRTDTLACKYCPHTFPEATAAILDGLSTAEGMAFVCDELKRRAA